MDRDNAIQFASQEWGGYNTNQVDEYIKKITFEYRNLYARYESLCREKERIREENSHMIDEIIMRLNCLKREESQ